MQYNLKKVTPLIEKKSVPDTIIKFITDSLIEKNLNPGDKLPTEIELSKMFGVARNSVREAIKVLSALGIVEIKRGTGSFIRNSLSHTIFNPLILSLAFEQGTSEELTELRFSFEAGIAELIMLKASETDLADLIQINNNIKKIKPSQKNFSYLIRDLDIDFHMRIIAITRNKMIIKIGQIIYPLYQASIEKKIISNPNLAYRNHLAVINKIRSQDLSGLLDAMRKWAESHDIYRRM